MSEREELAALLPYLPDEKVRAILADARLTVTMVPPADSLDEETRQWMDADLTPPLEDEDWSFLPKGKPIEWDEARGAFVVIGGKD